MRLWTIQPESLYNDLVAKKVIHCEPSKSELITEWGFDKPYKWLVEQMKTRIGQPPIGVEYPIWAWHTFDWKNKKPDLRNGVFRGYEGPQVCIELEIPDEKVLLSDESAWHIVLNNGFFGDATNDEEFDKEYEWFDNLPIEEQERIKVKSWEKVFNVTPFKSDWETRGRYVQATFWELRLSEVISVRHFNKGKKK